MKYIDIKKLNQKYEKIEIKKKILLLLGIFCVVIVICSEYLFFGSLDSFNKSSEARKEQMQNKLTLQKQKQDLALSIAEKSQNNLQKQKQDLTKDVEKLLNTNKQISYVSPQKIPEIIGKIIDQVGSLSIMDFRNIPSSPSNAEVSSSSVSELINHNFILEVSGSYQAVYDLLNKFKESNIVHVNSVVINKKEMNLNAKIEFYVINTNKNIVSF